MIDTYISELAVLAVFQLKAERNDRIIRIGCQLNRRFVFIQIERFVGNFTRIGQIISNGVKQRLNTSVFIRRTEEYRHEFFFQCSLAYRSADHLFRFGSLQEGFSKLVGEHGRGIQHFFTVFLCIVQQMRRNFRRTDFGTALPFKIERLHRYQIDNTFKFVLKPDRQLHHVCIQAELFAQLHPHL